MVRELFFDEIFEIRVKIFLDMDIEVFMYGVMCIFYFGRCLISNYMIGRDVNKGFCV